MQLDAVMSEFMAYTDIICMQLYARSIILKIYELFVVSRLDFNLYYTSKHEHLRLVGSPEASSSADTSSRPLSADEHSHS